MPATAGRDWRKPPELPVVELSRPKTQVWPIPSPRSDVQVCAKLPR